MNKYLIQISLYFILANNAFGQELKQLTRYPYQRLISKIFYHSDSLIYAVEPVWFPNLGYYYLSNDKEWKLSSFRNGALFAKPGSKTYFIDQNSFSTCNPITHKLENSISLPKQDVPRFFEVYKDSFYITVPGNSTDPMLITFFKDDKIIKSDTLINHGTYYYSKVVQPNDSELIILQGNRLYKKNLNSGTLDTVTIYSMYDFDVYQNHLVAIYDEDYIGISNDYGDSFTTIPLWPFLPSDAFSFKLSKYGISFFNKEGLFITLDFEGNKIGSNNLIPLLNKLTAEYSTSTCYHNEITNKPTWFNDTTLMISSTDGDIYKVFPFDNNKVKYVGGCFNMGVEHMHFDPSGKFGLLETANGLWGVSSDTGKTWVIPQMNIPNKVNRFKFVDSFIYILDDYNLIIYNFNTKILDYSISKYGLLIKNFGMINKNQLILFANDGTYRLDLSNQKLLKIGPSSPFQNYAVLEKANTFLAFTTENIYYSNNHGQLWTKSEINGFEFFSTLKVTNSLNILEASIDNFSLNVQIDNKPCLLITDNGGKNFRIEFSKDTSTWDAIATIKLYDDKYSIKNEYILKSNIISTVSIDEANYNCTFTGLQAFDSGYIAWNSRAEIFYIKIPYKKVYPYQDKITVFPNPLSSNSSLNIAIPKDDLGRIGNIEVYDMLGKKLINILAEYAPKENIYKLKNWPDRSPQFYIINIKIKDGVSHRQKVFVY